ncbi:transcriptional regulator [Striga asiatica]|uniref:Transcriptional regulator n=1 Tax=Striga asiatica TaxID=4170 RepID=A0A5A7QT98_STRAF|nr:transcriptional regulator [Striga asiatica]
MPVFQTEFLYLSPDTMLFLTVKTNQETTNLIFLRQFLEGNLRAQLNLGINIIIELSLIFLLIPTTFSSALESNEFGPEIDFPSSFSSDPMALELEADPISKDIKRN